MTEGESDYPSVTFGDSSPDKGSLNYQRSNLYMKATGIVRRIDDLGRVVIPKEIRRTMRIREGDPLHITLTLFDKFCWAIHSVVERAKAR